MKCIALGGRPLDSGNPFGWGEDINNQEVIMRNALPSTGLIAHSKALEANQTATALRLFDDVRAITWRLLHP